MPDFDLRPDDSLGLLIDVQERFMGAIPAIAEDGPVGRAMGILLRGLELLAVPVVVSRQYPQGLGDTLPHLRAAAPSARNFDKTAFSVGDDPALLAACCDDDHEVVIVAGIETHICVLSSVDDLVRRGRRVVVAADAVASRSEAHRDHALRAMRDLGALVVPVESILFRLQRQAGVGAFKAISALVK